MEPAIVVFQKPHSPNCSVRDQQKGIHRLGWWWWKDRCVFVGGRKLQPLSILKCCWAGLRLPGVAAALHCIAHHTPKSFVACSRTLPPTHREGTLVLLTCDSICFTIHNSHFTTATWTTGIVVVE